MFLSFGDKGSEESENNERNRKIIPSEKFFLQKRE